MPSWEALCERTEGCIAGDCGRGDCGRGDCGRGDCDRGEAPDFTLAGASADAISGVGSTAGTKSALFEGLAEAEEPPAVLGLRVDLVAPELPCVLVAPELPCLATSGAALARSLIGLCPREPSIFPSFSIFLPTEAVLPPATSSNQSTTARTTLFESRNGLAARWLEKALPRRSQSVVFT